MPSPLLAAGIAAGANVIGSAIGAVSQGKMNRATRRWNEKMYARQRADALADWNMSNEYNSPQQQMARLKMAGLNPNLVYGNGAVANTDSQVRSADKGSWNPQAPELPIGQAAGAGIAAFQDVRLKDAQINSLNEGAKVKAEDAKLKVIKQVTEQVNQALSDAKLVGTKIANYKAGALVESQLEAAQLAIDQQKAGLLKTAADTQFTLDSNRRAGAITASQLITNRLAQAKTQAETEQLQLGMQNLIKDGVLKQLEIDMRKTGATWSDPLWQRKLMQLWQKYMIPKKGSILDRASEWMRRDR